MPLNQKTIDCLNKYPKFNYQIKQYPPIKNIKDISITNLEKIINDFLKKIKDEKIEYEIFLEIKQDLIQIRTYIECHYYATGGYNKSISNLHNDLCSAINEQYHYYTDFQIISIIDNLFLDVVIPKIYKEETKIWKIRNLRHRNFDFNYFNIDFLEQLILIKIKKGKDVYQIKDISVQLEKLHDIINLINRSLELRNLWRSLCMFKYYNDAETNNIILSWTKNLQFIINAETYKPYISAQEFINRINVEMNNRRNELSTNTKTSIKESLYDIQSKDDTHTHFETQLYKKKSNTKNNSNNKSKIY